MYDTIYFKSGETKPPGHKRGFDSVLLESGCETSIGTQKAGSPGSGRAVACQLYPPPMKPPGMSKT